MVSNGTNNYLVQALIKSRMGPGYMAEYLNTMIKLYTLHSHNLVVIDIWGACWGRVGKNKNKTTVTDLVDRVFDGIPTNGLKIRLRDKYPGFSADDIKDALSKKNYNTQIIGKSSNHGKIVGIYRSNEERFLMVGSSNFSYNTYVNDKPFIDQADVAFIKANPTSANIILPITHFESGLAQGNLLLEPWAQESVSAEGSNVNDGLWAEYMSGGRRDGIINTPYSTNGELFPYCAF